MTSWQKRARAGIAVAGIGFGIVVYLALGDRQAAPVVASGRPLDPGVVAACTGGRAQNWTGEREDYLVESSSCVTYEDGRTEMDGVRIVTRDRDDRDFVIKSGKGVAGKDNQTLALSGGVVLEDSTGFHLRTDAGTFQRSDGTVRAEGPISFDKGGMTGSSVGMTYDENADVLTLLRQALVNLAQTDEAVGMNFTAGTATLDRRQDLLTMEQGVHGLQGEQITTAERAVARLSTNEDTVTFVELRGQARVTGGDGPLQSMAARDIDLDYSDDGQYIERATLMGSGAVALETKGGGTAREFAGEWLDIAMAGDGSVTKIQGENAVRMTLPASLEAPGRSIRAKSMLATGDVGGTISQVRFTDDVEFREAAQGEADERIARSRTLTLALSDDMVSSADFRGNVTFEEGDLKASAPEAAYSPERESLRLSGRAGAARPHAADATVSIDADGIDIGLKDRRIDATGAIKTTILPSRARRPGASKAGAGHEPSGLPGLLEQNEPAFVTADTKLVYEGASGNAVYTGRVVLWQKDTEVKGDTVDIQQDTGDLIATGSARSSLRLDGGSSEGEAHVIRYDDRRRTVTYTAATGKRPDGAPSLARVRGAQGDLRAGNRIEVYLAEAESKVERLEAYASVTGAVEDVTMTGDRLTYRATEDRYDVTGTNRTLARADIQCQRFTGNTLTFSRSADTIKVDGRQVVRTRTARKSGC